MDNNNMNIQNQQSIINPEFWAFIAVNKAIESLGTSSENVNSNFLKFISLVNTAESICRGQNKISDEFNKEIEKFKKDEKISDTASIVAQTKICNKKIELIAKAIGETSDLSTPLKLTKDWKKSDEIEDEEDDN